MRSFATFVCVVAITLARTAPSSAAGTLDQELVVRGAASLARVNSELSLAQTFTVGQTGLLDRVEVQVELPSSPTPRPVEPLVVEVRRTIDGRPDRSEAGVLASFSVPPASVPASVFGPTMLGVDLGAQSLLVTEGDVLALGLRSDEVAIGGVDGDRGYRWALTSLTGQILYHRGEMHSRSAASGDDFVRLSELPSNPSNIDGGFRTFVTVPEPGALGVVGAGVLLLRRRKGTLSR